MNELLKDWIGDRDASFVTRNDKNKLEWEKISGKGSQFVFGKLTNLSDEKKIVMSYQYATARLSAMGLQSTKLNISHKNHTCGKVIHVDNRCLSDESLSDNEVLDVFIGEITHEAAHVLFTDFTSLNAVKHSKLEVHVLNILEDERIEKLLSKDFAGYIEDIAVIKEYFFNRVSKEVKNDADEILQLLFKFIRFPKDIDLDLVNKHEGNLCRIKKILTPYPTDYDVLSEKAFEIAKIIEEMIDKNKEDNEQDDPKGSNTDDGVDEGDSNDGKEKNDQKDSTDGDSNGKSNKDDSENEGKNDDSKSDDDTKGNGKEETNGEDTSGSMQSEQKSIKEQLNEIADKWSDLQSANDTNSDKKNSEVVEHNSLFIDEVDGVFDLQYGVNFTKTVVNRSSDYSKIKSVMQPYIGQMRNKLRLLDYSEKQRLIGLKSGRLDGNKLVDAIQGVQTVYERDHYTTMNKLNVAILLDESGSMSGRVYFMGRSMKRIEVAQFISVMLVEAFDKLKNVDLFIYGHTTNEGSAATEISIYKEGNFSNKGGIAQLTSKHYNRDGVAIKKVAERIRTFNKNRTLFLVLSDGQPSAKNYGGSNAIEHTRRMVKRIEKDRFVPVQIGIETKYKTHNPMFDNWLNYSDMNLLLKDFSKMIQKFVEENI